MVLSCWRMRPTEEETVPGTRIGAVSTVMVPPLPALTVVSKMPPKVLFAGSLSVAVLRNRTASAVVFLV